MDISRSENYTYLQRICESLKPRDDEELIFKMRLKWLLDVASEQSDALANIEEANMALNSDLSSIPPPPSSPNLKLIKGGAK